MHFLSLRERSSKVYADRCYNIPLNNDRSHLHATHSKVQQAKTVQQRRQIDKIMQGIIKERLFANFIDEKTRISDDSYSKISSECRKGFFGLKQKDRSRKISDMSKTIDVIPNIPKKKGKKVEFDVSTIQFFSSQKKTEKKEANFQDQKRLIQSEIRTRRQSMRLPDMEQFETSKNIKGKTAPIPNLLPKRLDVNEKIIVDLFRKWSGAGPQVLVNEVKMTKEQLLNKLKHLIDVKILQKFLHFFGFGQSFGVRNLINFIENAANCHLRFIYFWQFIVLDQYSNGVLTLQDFFQFFQKFSQNDYVQGEIFAMIKQIQKLKVAKRDDIEVPPEQSLTVNRNLRMEQLKDIIKQSGKEIINVPCLKSTAYHLTILSLEHDPLERAKLNKIQTNEAATRLMKLKMKEEKKKLEQLIGLRLRDFPFLFNGRRPRLFCYILHLLAGVKPDDYE